MAQVVAVWPSVDVSLGRREIVSMLFEGGVSISGSFIAMLELNASLGYDITADMAAIGWDELEICMILEGNPQLEVAMKKGVQFLKGENVDVGGGLEEGGLEQTTIMSPRREALILRAQQSSGLINRGREFEDEK